MAKLTEMNRQIHRHLSPGHAPALRLLKKSRLGNRALVSVAMLTACVGLSASPSAGGPLGPGIAADVSLDGVWNFIPDPNGTMKVGDLPSGPSARPINVPGSWQAQ